MNQIGLKFTIWWPKQSSVIEKVKPHRARIPFRKLVKTCSKWFALPHFFYFIPNYGSNGVCPQKMSQIGLKLTIWWPKQCSLFEKVQPDRARIPFRKLVKTCSKWFALPHFFYFIPNYGSNGVCPQKMSQIGLKLTIWWPKQCSLFEKVQPDRARILFWKSVKTFPKWRAPPNVFNLSPTMAQVELAHKKSQIGLKLTIWWPKQSSGIEKVKPHRARILFLKIGKNLSKMARSALFFLFYHKLWPKWSLPKKWAKMDWNWRFGDRNKVQWSKKLSLIERGYLFEKW